MSSMAEIAAEPVPRVPRWRGAFGLVAALSTLVVSTGARTALVIHLSWSWTAQQNVAAIVGQLNAQIAGPGPRGVGGLGAATPSPAGAGRSIFAPRAPLT